MILIQSNSSRNLTDLALTHFNDLKLVLERRVSKLRSRKWLRKFLTDNLEDIIVAPPAKLIAIYKKLNKEIVANGALSSVVDTDIKQIFDYDKFISNKAKSYAFAQRLGINCCPYCNRNYIVTVIEQNSKTVVRPDFDHFFPKSKYPLLSLSFYNLIPSCMICNRSIKLAQDLVYKKYVHPYEEEYGGTLKFNFRAKDTDSAIGLKTNIEITPLIDWSNKAKAERCIRSFKLFKLNEIYEASHLTELAEILRKYHVSGGRYIEILHKNFKSLGTVEELYKIAFGTYFQTEDFEKRPLSKLTKDIVEQLRFYTPNIP